MTDLVVEESTLPRVRRGAGRRLLSNPFGFISLSIVTFVVIVGIVGQWIVPFDPNLADLGIAFSLPDGLHWLGTDSAGRDVLSRIIIGSRSTLLAAAIAAIVAIAIGLPTGLIAGYFGGWFDFLANWCSNALMSLPAIIILLAVNAALGKSVFVSMAVFGVLMSPGIFRLTFTSVRAVRSELYVDAARVAGLSNFRIIGKHVLIVVRAPLIIQASMLCGIAISVQAILDFLGLGDLLIPTWGMMLSEGFANIYNAPLLAVWSGATISVVIGAFVVLGNAIRDALEDKQEIASPQSIRESRIRANDNSQRQTNKSTDHLLKVSDLSIGYPEVGGDLKLVVSGVSFHVDKGEVLGIVGESGSGKTQTAFTVLGLLPDEATIAGGSVTFGGNALVAPDGKRLSQALFTPLRGTRIAYIPQEPMSNLDPNFTIGHQLVRPMTKLLRISKAEAKRRAIDLLNTVGINDPQRTFAAYPHQISGGMAQRVLIAGAISCEPDLLIADEPTTALDVTVQADILDLLRELQQKLSMAVVLVTHNIGVVADLCDRVVVMQTGRVVESGAVRDVLGNPQEPYTQALLAAMLEGKTPMTMLAPDAEAQASASSSRSDETATGEER
jgi:ABC-type dipeptide/oligopeptide/nickel transport system ATPase component/ABC-type dipeptide/oligopeptide/nickel transport system permease subunit